MNFFNLLNAVLFLSTADAFSIRDDHVLHERRHITPSPWIKRSQAPRDVILPVRIAIESRNIERGHEFLMDISDPTSPNFGKHWTPKEVHDTFAPAQETVRAVREWLSSSGIAAHRHKVAVGRGQILFKASVDEIESLLGTQYDVWEHDETGALSIACDEYHVPQPIKHIISFITPTIGITAPRSSKYSRRGVQKETNRQGRPLLLSANDNPATNLSNCQDRITPACVKALYQVPPGNSAQAGNELGIYEFGDDYDQGDLNLFFANFSPNIPNGTSPILQSIDGGSAPVPIQDGGGESALDLQLSYPLIYPQNIKVFQTMDDFTADNTYGIFNPFLDALDASYCTFDGGDDPQIDPHFPDGHGWNHSEQCGVYKPTHVISLSAEIAEAAYPPAYAIRQCHEYLKLGLLGTSIIFSSGDNGTVSQSGVLGCLANDSQNPGFPSSCPYVTSVGATQIKPGATVSDPEIAVFPGGGTFPDGIDPFTSGGGFSNVFSRPSYQKSVVTSYLQIDTAQLPPSSTYNSTGRAFPDVSANGWNIAVYLQGFSFTLWGTSASAPIFASVINRLNEERLAAGKGPVGFLNPILYSNPDMFNDITEGYNWGCNAAIAFYAQKGWDPVTGLGTPNYPKMRKVFLELP